VRSATAHTLPALRDPLHRSLSPGTDHTVLGKGGVAQARHWPSKGE